MQPISFKKKRGFIYPRILLQCQLHQLENVPESKMTKFQTAFGITDAWSADYPENSSIGKT